MKAVFTIGVLCMVMNARSQTWHYGLKMDLNYSGLSGTGVQSKLSYNFQAGAFTAYELSKKWSLQAELLYNQNTYKRTSDFLKYYPNTGKTNSSEKIYMSYASIPLLLKYRVNNLLSVHAGPQYSARIYSNENLLKDNADAFKKNEWSVNAGVEASVSFVSIYLRYNRGLTDVNNADDRYAWKAQRLQAGIAFKIR